MSNRDEIAALFRRDLIRLAQQVEAFGDDASLWEVREGITNSAGNLVLHLEGNLREYIGRQLGNLPYARRRPEEFATAGLSRVDLMQRIKFLEERIPGVIACLSDDNLKRDYPEDVLGVPISTGLFLIHLHGHLNYHLGQIDYLRRFLTQGKAIALAGL